MIYLCDAEMSRYGIYTIFSYRAHELISAIPLLSILITMGWIITLIVQIVKEKKLRPYLSLGALLLIVGIGQMIYLNNRAHTVMTSLVTPIDRVNRDKMEIVIETERREVRLDCPMIVLDVLKTDGTEYGITYEWNKKNPGYGKLCIVQAIL